MKRTEVIRFTPEEMKHIARVAESRNFPKAKAGIRPRYAGKTDTAEMHLAAARAEYAVCRLYGWEWDHTVTARGNRQGNIIGPTFRAMAKMRPQRGYDLALKSDSLADFLGEVGFLVWPEFADAPGAVEIIGWISRAEFAAKARLTSYTQGQHRLYVPPRTLHGLDHWPTPHWEPAPVQEGLW